MGQTCFKNMPNTHKSQKFQPISLLLVVIYFCFYLTEAHPIDNPQYCQERLSKLGELPFHRRCNKPITYMKYGKIRKNLIKKCCQQTLCPSIQKKVQKHNEVIEKLFEGPTYKAFFDIFFEDRVRKSKYEKT